MWEIETLRTRLAVAMVSCRKQSTLGMWTRYFETESRIRGILRCLRSDYDGKGSSPVCVRALRLLRQAPEGPDSPRPDTEAQALCDRLADVAGLLEREGEPAGGRLRPNTGIDDPPSPGGSIRDNSRREP